MIVQKQNGFGSITEKIRTVFQSNGKRYLIRQNAIRRNDSTYLTYINNTIFCVSNMIGEICLNRIAENVQLNPFNCINGFTEEFNEWISDRITEGVITETHGTNQEERMMALLRKMIMALMHVRRYGWALTLNIEEFVNKVNENLINRPLAMYWQVCLIDILNLIYLM